MKSTFLRLLGIMALSVLLTATYSCKSKKKLAEAEAEKQRIERMEAERQAREEEEARRKREEEERMAREREAAAKAAERAPYDKLNQFFSSIANSSSESAANNSISEALNMFTSKEAPVLIIIYENSQENVVDYDEPTTIDKYLHYLKVVKRKPDTIKDIKFNANGKISELILKKD